MLEQILLFRADDGGFSIICLNSDLGKAVDHFKSCVTIKNEPRFDLSIEANGEIDSRLTEENQERLKLVGWCFPTWPRNVITSLISTYSKRESNNESDSVQVSS